MTPSLLHSKKTLLVGITAFLILFSWLWSKEYQNRLTANVVPSEQFELLPFHTAVTQKDMPVIQELLEGFGQSDIFQNDVEQCTQIYNVSADVLDGGFWLSFLCRHEGDSLHPYFGFFPLSGEKKIIWATPPRGKIVSEQVQENQKIVAIENISNTVWDVQDTWRNSLGQEVKVSARHEKQYVHKGEVALFVTNAQDDILWFENQEHYFYINLWE